MPANIRLKYGCRARSWRYTKDMTELTHIAFHYVSQAAEALTETLWPTRCAVCDAPGEVLCTPCRLSLPYLDWWRACPRCGAPFGKIQCSECNPVMLERRGCSELPYAGCASAVTFEESTARIVRTYKDQGERRLCEPLAQLMAHAVAPHWSIDALCPLPASKAAQRRRGFDHAELLTTALAELLEKPAVSLLARPHARDQRKLSRRARLKNMEGRFQALPHTSFPRHVLLIDDVYTTGATLFDACDALHQAGVEEVFCLTFARVW